VHEKDDGGDADYAFDLRFDRTKGGDSFSCDLEIRASEAATAIEAFRFGVLYDSEDHIRDSVLFPLAVGIQDTRSTTEEPRSLWIANFAEWETFKKAHLSKLQLAMIACASLRNVKIVKSRTYGFMIGSGMVWFEALTNVPGVRVTAINLVPVEPDDVLESCGQQ
jgi:hypothetical protein